jgi:N-acetylglutamate synthase-like GNAT family acetyltransferase
VGGLHFEQVQPTGGEAARRDWRHIHNLIIPADPLSADEIRERAQRNHLEVAYLDGAAVGCSTVRPPAPGTATATVIARVLPEHRRHGYGEQIYLRGLAKAHELGAQVIETVILASNDDGLRFARRRGFVEIDRYVLPGDTTAYVDLRLA